MDDERKGKWTRKNPDDWFKMDGWDWASNGYPIEANPYDRNEERKQHSDFIEGWHAYHDWNRKSLRGAWAAILAGALLFSLFAYLTA